MDRVSGWFKRRSQYVLLTIGLLLSLALNADTISITNSLATDKSVRTSLISAATEAAKNPAPGAPSYNFQADVDQIRTSGLPLGWKWDGSSPDPGTYRKRLWRGRASSLASRSRRSRFRSGARSGSTP